MEQLNRTISENLKRMREAKRLSLDNLAKLSGVSKSMLGQIERCEVNPTVGTVWKIANGLKVSFSTLISERKSETQIIQKKDIVPIFDDDGRFRNYLAFPFDDERKFEMLRIEIDSGGRLRAEPHPKGTLEFLTVFSGSLRVTLADESFIVERGDSIRFAADVPHSYCNEGASVVELSMVLYYEGIE